jgi:PTH1 family peptidyl-tRNA hydrolase
VTGTPLKLIVGLGNPGAEYARTRHNAGFWFVEELAGTAGWKRESKHQCLLAKGRVGAVEPWLAKPTTYMNRSGAAVQSLAAFYRITPAEILVVHDEIDLAPGDVRLKQGGGHGGHNGVRDVIATIGADFWRLRIGVGHPGNKDDVIDAVLDRPTGAEQRQIEGAMQRAHEVIAELVAGEGQKAMLRLHTKDKQT